MERRKKLRLQLARRALSHRRACKHQQTRTPEDTPPAAQTSQQGPAVRKRPACSCKISKWLFAPLERVHTT
jgi:hypothetical protein